VLAAGCGIGGVLAGPLLDALARAVPLEQPVLPLRRPGRLTVVVSLVTGVLAALVALAFDGSWLLPAQLWLLGLAVVLTVTDLQHRRLPNALLLPGGAVLAVLLVAGALLDGRPGGLLGSAVTAGALFALFLLAAVVSPSGMGMGDVKLAGVLGLALGLAGTAATLLAVLVAFALHAVVSVVLLATRRAGRRTALPFGPALLVGAGVALGWLSPLAA
jgi:leader peptidase (prepilin peptidase)/N-methyltransferase